MTISCYTCVRYWVSPILATDSHNDFIAVDVARAIDQMGVSISTLLGQDVRAMRKARGITLKTLASELDRSVGWLSQLERGQTSPSVRDLDLIADYFGLDVSFFFRGAAATKEEQGLVRRRADRVPVGKLAPGLTEELLSPALGGAFEMLMSVFEPHHDGEGSMPARSTEEGGVVISGQLTITIGDLEVKLEAGDSVQFKDTDYTWRNEGDVPVVVFWVIAPPVLRGDPAENTT